MVGVLGAPVLARGRSPRWRSPPRCWPATASCSPPRAPLAGERLRRTLVRAGIPEELLAVVHGDAARAALPDACARDRLARRRPEAKGAMLVLEGAPVETVASAALWAAFAAGGRHPAAAGGSSCVPSVAEPLLGCCASAPCAGGRRPRERAGGDRPAALGRGPRGGRGARRGGRRRRRGADLRRRHAASRASPAPFYAPAVLRRVPAGARILREPVPGPVLAVVEAPGEAAAIALVQDGPADERPRTTAAPAAAS